MAVVSVVNNVGFCKIAVVSVVNNVKENMECMDVNRLCDAGARMVKVAMKVCSWNLPSITSTINLEVVKCVIRFRS